MMWMPPVHRPRWTTIRSLLYIGGAVYISLHLLLGMPFLSSNFPKYTGKYAVGVVDIEVPCAQKGNISDEILKETGEVAFKLDTVLFSVYYPAVTDAVTRAPHHSWVEKPLSTTAEGYARFMKINNVFSKNIFRFGLWMLAGSTHIPANVDAPLHGTGTIKTYLDFEAEHPSDDYGLPRFPLLVFSHGMASSRTSYSQYCAEMASRGFIVAAIEHRDGSGPGTIIHDGKNQKLRFTFNPTGLEPQPDIAAFKSLQLSMRQAEVAETVRVLREINDGRGQAIYEANTRGEGTDLPAWKDRIMWDRIVIGGHSFGATLALQLSVTPTEALPFVGTIAFDPGKNSGPLQDDISVPLLVVHSQSWSAKASVFQGRPHFDVVKDLVQKVAEDKKKYAWFLTCRKSSHASVTDAPIIEPFLLSWSTGSEINARQGVLQYVKITQQFLNYLENGHRQSILKEAISHHFYDDPNARTVDPKIGEFWQIHMSPSVDCPAAGYCGLDNADG